MKTRYILMALVAGLAFASCQQDGLPDAGGGRDNLIRFAAPGISVEAGTRSTSYEVLPEGAEFGVLGYCVPYVVGTNTPDYNGGASPWGTKYALCPPSVFYQTPVIVGAGSCSYDKPRYWYRPGYGLDGQANSSVGSNADSYRYTFFAYYPYEGGFNLQKPAGQDVAGAPRFTFTMPQDGDGPNAGLDHRKNPDAMFAVLHNQQRAQGNVTFNFSHILTGLGFEINNFSDSDLQIHSLTLSGTFYRQISLDFTSGSLAYSFPENYYQGTYTVFNESMNNGQSLELPAPTAGQERTTSGLLPKKSDGPQDVTGEGEHLLLISGVYPYLGPNDDMHINLHYTFGGEEKNESFGRPGTFLPRPGTKYVTQLNFVGNAFVLQFVVDNSEHWEDGGADNDGNDVVFE